MSSQRWPHMTYQKIDELIQKATMKLLDESRFYGEVVLRLNRVYDDTVGGTMGLSWQAPFWELRINPILFEEVYHSVTDVKGALTHQVLHMVWEHPIRYADKIAENAAEAKMVGLATDLSANQYIRGGFPGAHTLAEVEEMIELDLPTYADSSTYYNLLHPLMDTIDNEGASSQLPGDDHKGWSTGAEAGEEAEATLRNVVADANHDALVAGRGNMAGEVERQIEQLLAPRRNWRGLLRKAMSNVPAGKQDSRARFNRRQPYRMELPGQVDALQWPRCKSNLRLRWISLPLTPRCMQSIRVGLPMVAVVLVVARALRRFLKRCSQSDTNRRVLSWLSLPMVTVNKNCQLIVIVD